MAWAPTQALCFEARAEFRLRYRDAEFARPTRGEGNRHRLDMENRIREIKDPLEVPVPRGDV